MRRWFYGLMLGCVAPVVWAGADAWQTTLQQESHPGVDLLQLHQDPDGVRVVYAARSSSDSDRFLLRLRQISGLPVSVTEWAALPGDRMRLTVQVKPVTVPDLPKAATPQPVVPQKSGHQVQTTPLPPQHGASQRAL